MSCHCGSQFNFNECCDPLLKGVSKPKTAEALMRSRYSAFVTANVSYLKNTLAPESRSDFDIQSTKKWAEQAKWKGLKILNCKQGSENDKKGTVEFIASYEITEEGENLDLDHHEVSQFRKDESGQWFFIEGEAHTHKAGEDPHVHEKIQTVQRESPKIGRNDPCLCGSGKKYKKCCGE